VIPDAIRVFMRFWTGSRKGESDLPQIVTPTLVNHTAVPIPTISFFLFQMAALEASISALVGKREITWKGGRRRTYEKQSRGKRQGSPCNL
jgi:hypothetical protein